MTPKTATTALDGFDHAILALVQRDNQQTHALIGGAVGLSPSAVRRRLARLRSEGVIEADVSLVDPAALGLTFIVSVRFAREAPDRIAAFKARMRAEPAVSQCYSVAGEADFILMVHAATAAACEAWGERTLMADPDVERYSSTLVWSRVKFAAAVEVAV
jgi:Lrp/AsnC family transcriptional regulator, leucine-responsive regulatory protein